MILKVLLACLGSMAAAVYSQQPVELWENILQNLSHNLTPQTVVSGPYNEWIVLDTKSTTCNEIIFQLGLLHLPTIPSRNQAREICHLCICVE